MTQTIGQRLKAEREEQRLTLEKVFESTRIRIPYLRALETDDLSVMPSPVQARGYLRNYAEYLGLDFEQMLHELREMNAQPASGEVIGPADHPSPPPQQANQEADNQTEARAQESLEIIQDEPVAEELTVLIKPKPFDRTQDKPARRKKSDSQSTPVSAEPEVVPVVEAPPDAEEIVPAVEAIPQPDIIQEPVAEEAIDIQREAPQPADVSDNLWQTWLNRVGSTLSARMKRRTLIPKESPVPKADPVVAPPPPELPFETETQSQLPANSKQILKEVGRELRQRRELLSLHFDEVERNTHVKAHYLDALERGALDELPSTVQTRGMLANYATFLDMDVDVLLLRFADALQARHRERNPQKPARKPGQPIIANMPSVRSFIAGDMVFGVGMAILLVGFAIWGVSRVMAVQSQREVEPTAPSISDLLLSSPDPSAFTVTATFLPVESFPGEATVTVEIPTQNVNAQVQLNLVAVERTYMRVVVDGEVAFEGRVVPGNAYPFEAESQVEVLVGSGAAIRIVYNGRDLGLMGTFGQVVNNIYLGTQIITPTLQSTVTATITATPTRTAPPTATSIFTSTPVPSATAVP
jgi:cytoskeleton protein RodZ